jgi:hypothetical protein
MRVVWFKRMHATSIFQELRDLGLHDDGASMKSSSKNPNGLSIKCGARAVLELCFSLS